MSFLARLDIQTYTTRTMSFLARLDIQTYTTRTMSFLAFLSPQTMRWLMLVGSIKLQISFTKEPHKRDAILQKRPIILSMSFLARPSPQTMGWLMLVASIKLQVSFAKEPHKRDAILQKRPIILTILLIVATPYPLKIELMCGKTCIETTDRVVRGHPVAYTQKQCHSHHTRTNNLFQDLWHHARPSRE